MNRFLRALVARLVVDTPMPNLSREQQIGMFSEMYQNATVRRYLDEREKWLIETGMNAFIENKLTDAKGYAGQLIEVREFRNRIKLAYLSNEKLRVDNNAKDSISKKVV